MEIPVTMMAAAVLALSVLVLIRWRRPRAGLTPGEGKIRDLVREVYAGSIVSERVERRGAEAVLIVELRNEMLADLQVNLSSLARKHEDEGVSLAALRISLRFD